jgi:hypothetical protein
LDRVFVSLVFVFVCLCLSVSLLICLFVYMHVYLIVCLLIRLFAPFYLLALLFVGSFVCWSTLGLIIG